MIAQIQTVRNYNVKLLTAFKTLFLASLCLYVIIGCGKFSSRMKNDYDKSMASKKLVWLEQLPYGDRVKDQIDYVPEGYKYKQAPIKTILIYTGQGDEWEHQKLDQGEFFGCSVSQCMLTVNRSFAPHADAVIFRHNYSRPSFKRHPNQIWIMYNTEAPYLAATPVDIDVFNWTADYRWDSDIPRLYGYFQEYKPQPPVESLISKNYAVNKTKKVAWFVSNCHPASNRKEYADELAKYISVDVYGRCGKFECPKNNKNECNRMLEKNYKFYLSFENAHCHYYITEKLFSNGLSYDILPIVLGASRQEYELVAPKNSFIHVDDFNSPKELADYLHKLDQNDDLYNEYFKWKGTGTIILDGGCKFFCRLCAMLHDENRPRKYYKNYTDYWNSPGVCRK